MQTMNVKHILIPVNVLNGSFDALQFAQGLADAVPIHVTLLNVVNLNVVALEGRIYDEVCAEREAALKKLAKHFFGDSPSVRIIVRVGRPHEEIVAEADAELSELIIMASPKPSHWKRFLGLGTVGRVVRNARCPTLVLPRVWKITPEQYRHAMRSRSDARSSVARQPNAGLPNANPHQAAAILLRTRTF
jgi:nucleotide-binding universal stress UspA family protein